MGGSAYINEIPKNTMDNFYPCKFCYNGYTWTSSEQAYQAMKFADKDHIQSILRETNISMIYFLGQVSYVNKTDSWKKNSTEEKLRLMYEINLAKFSQNEDLKRILIESNGEIYFKGDRFWGKKGRKGLNWNGQILMKIRKELIDIG